MARWFGRFPIEWELREDTYLLEPRLHGLSVKVRGGRSLEVKVYRGGRFWMWRAAPAVHGVLAKWSAFLEARSTRTAATNTAATRLVGSQYAKGDASAGSHWPADRSWRAPRGWIRSRGVMWNTESPPVAKTGGPWGSRRATCQSYSAAHSMHRPARVQPPLPGGAEPGLDESMSYMQWLSQQPPDPRAPPTPEDSARCRAGCVVTCPWSAPTTPSAPRHCGDARATPTPRLGAGACTRQSRCQQIKEDLQVKQVTIGTYLRPVTVWQRSCT